MTIPAGEITFSLWTGNGSNTLFDYEFKITNAADLKVTTRTTDGVATVLTLGSDYTVSGVGADAGGQISLTTALADQYTIMIEDNVAFSQEQAFGNQTEFFGTNHEAAFDKNVRLIKRAWAREQRAIRLPDADPITEMVLPAAADRANKFQMYGANGELVLSESIPDSVAFNANTIGDNLYRRTPAEAAAGIQAYTVLNGIGNIMFPQYPPADARRYGVDPTGVTECRAALQASINAASHAAATGSGYGVAKWPAGKCLCNGELRGFYDGTLNDGYIDNGQPGRFEIHGEGCGGFSDLQADLTAGTVIQFTHTSGGDGLLVGPSTASGLSGRSFSLKGVSLRGSIDGQAILRLRNLSQALLIERLTVKNGSTATPYGIIHEGITFGGLYNQVYIVSSKNGVGGSVETDGIGYWQQTTGGAGGNVTYINFNAKAFYTGIQIGQQFEFGVTASAGTHNFINSQAQECVNNWWFRHGAYQVTVDNSWSENGDAGGAALFSDMKFSDSCGFNATDTAPDNPGRPGVITIIGGQHNSDGVGHEKFKCGDDTGVVGRDRHGPLLFKNARASVGGSNGPIWRCHNTKGNGAIVLDDVMLGGNGFGAGVVRIDADEAQYGPIIVTNPTTFWRVEPGEWCKEDATGASMFGKYFSQLLPTLEGIIGDGDVTVDYTNQAVLPSRITVAPANGEVTTINVPKNFLAMGNSQVMDVIKTVVSTGKITFNAGLVQAWGAGSAYKYGPLERVSSGGRTYMLKSGEENAPANAPTHLSSDGGGSGAVTYADGITWQWYSNSDTDLINGASSVTITGDRITARLVQTGRRTWSVSVLPLQVPSTSSTASDIRNDLRLAGVLERP